MEALARRSPPYPILYFGTLIPAHAAFEHVMLSGPRKGGGREKVREGGREG